MRAFTIVAALALLAACGDSTGPRYADIADARIRIVSGDGQVAPVATSRERAGDLAPGTFDPAAIEDNFDLFPEVLEAWVGVGSALTGEPVPPGTDTHWIVRDEGCGRPFGDTRSTDADGRVVNRWIRGIVARECRMDVCRILSDGAVACDTTFVAVQEPGPVYRAQWKFGGWVCVGDTVDLRDYFVYGFDGFGNRLDTDRALSELEGAIQWRWKDRVLGSRATGPTGSGFLVPVPDLGAHNFNVARHIYGRPGDPDSFERLYYAGGVEVSIKGRIDGYAFAGDVFLPEYCPR